ncbi:hypothetical protein [Pseudanabaena sp. UWO311]|nr:hypothetical protein [Pseudanabaena sp. UWO311]
MFTKQSELTYIEYLAYEHESQVKHEFVNGQAFAIALSDIYEDVKL